LKSPVLFIVFNRPDTTRRVFEAIRSARPPRLYIAADGPRSDRSGEDRRCLEVRKIASAVDWPCQVSTLYQPINLGCKIGVSTAISWFFENEEEGIVLEDDVLPLPTFFEFCDELLERYRNEERVAMISGCNLVANHFATDRSYFFSHYNHIWGWASWRRAWRHYDVAMKAWPAWRDANGLAAMRSGGRLFEHYWRHTLNAAYRGEIDTWDYQWTFACWRSGGLTVLPAVNQTHNLGFGADATHTVSEAPDYVTASAAKPMPFPLVHPASIERAARADDCIDSVVFGISPRLVLKKSLLSSPPLRALAARYKAMIRAGTK
jgi:hypothetical protein